MYTLKDGTVLTYYSQVALTASSKPAEIDVVILDSLRADEEENLLRLLIIACRCLGLCIVKVEAIIIEEVALLEERRRE